MQDGLDETEKREFKFQVPFSVVDSGALAAMSLATVKVYMCLCRHRNFKTCNAWPSAATIQKETGVSRNSVFRALRWLVACGLILRRRGSKKMNFVNIYRIILEPKITIPPSRTVRKYKKRRQKRDKSGKWGEVVSEMTPPSCTVGEYGFSCTAAKYRKDNEVNRRKQIKRISLILKEAKGQRSRFHVTGVGEKDYSEVLRKIEKTMKDKDGEPGNT